MNQSSATTASTGGIIVLENLHLATMAGGRYGEVRDAKLVFEGDSIVWLGPAAQCPEQWRELPATDCQQQWATPGLIDCHTHLVYGGNRAQEFEKRLQGVSYEEIARAGGGILATVKATRDATEQQLFASAKRRLDAMTTAGVTTLEIKSGYGLDLKTELKMLRVAARLGELHCVDVHSTFLAAHALPEEYLGESDAFIDLVCNDYIPAVAEQKLATSVDAFCENIGFSYAQCERVLQTAKEHGLTTKLHAEQLSNQRGALLAAKLQALSADHLEHLSRDSIEEMAIAGTCAVLLPGAYYFLRETNKPPLDLLRDNAISMAIATDCNPGTSPTTSLLLMMNMAATLFEMTPEETLQGTTLAAAKALGVSAQIGSLEVGKRADIALWDIEHPAELTYHIGANPCTGVYKNGQRVLSNQ